MTRRPGTQPVPPVADGAAAVTAADVVMQGWEGPVHARVVEVSAEIGDGVLELTIHDDGAGGAEPGRGSGLIGLIDRVEAIGGKLAVSSPPGEGTTMEVRLPLGGPSPDR